MIIGHNQPIEYNARMTNTFQAMLCQRRLEILEENLLNPTGTATEVVYLKEDQVRYAYLFEVGGMSESPGYKSIISDERLSYREALDAMLRAESK